MLIARNDGIDRIVAGNNNLTAKRIGNVERHNERKKGSCRPAQTRLPQVPVCVLPADIFYSAPYRNLLQGGIQKKKRSDTTCQRLNFVQ